MKILFSLYFYLFSCCILASDNFFKEVDSLKNKATYIINNKQEFLEAIESCKEHDILYVKGEIEINLSDTKNIEIKEGIKLIGDREISRSKGALLYTDEEGVFPFINVIGDNVLIAGLRIRGNDGKVLCDLDKFEGKDKEDINKNYLKYYNENMNCDLVSCGIYTRALLTTIFNCELFQWTHTSIYVQKGAKEIKIMNNFIHHNQRFGLGYGVTVNSGSAIVWNNKFQFNRHSIASTGREGSIYDVRYNIFLEDGNNSWAIDMHGGVDRKDGSDLAGEFGIIEFNTFYLDNKAQAVVFRGKSNKNSFIRYNKVILMKNSTVERDKIFQQKNNYGNFYVSDNDVRTIKK